MGTNSKAVMWTAQTQRVLDTLEKDGVYYVKKQYVEEKYQETAWSFRLAYHFMGEQMAKRVKRPIDAESPVWMYKEPKWAGAQGSAPLIELEVPSEELILFDLRKWNRILNMSLVGTEAEQRTLDEELKRQGISDISDVFQKPFYPVLKRKVMKSWEKLFEETDVEEGYLQGASWRLRKEWIVSIKN